MATHVLEMFSSSTSYDLPLRSQVAHGRPLWEACDLSDALGNQATVSSALKSVNTWDLCFTPEFVPQGHGGARTLAHHLQPEHPPFLVTLHQSQGVMFSFFPSVGTFLTSALSQTDGLLCSR